MDIFSENVEIQGFQLSSFKVQWNSLSHHYWWKYVLMHLSKYYVHIYGPSDPFLSSENNPKFCRSKLCTIRYIKKIVSRRVKKLETT